MGRYDDDDDFLLTNTYFLGSRKSNYKSESRRSRPQMGARHERTEALENITSSFCDVQQQKLSYEQMKVQLLMDEKIFKDRLYTIQLATAEKELEIKVEILKQIQST